MRGFGNDGNQHDPHSNENHPHSIYHSLPPAVGHDPSVLVNKAYVGNGSTNHNTGVFHNTDVTKLGQNADQHTNIRNFAHGGRKVMQGFGNPEFAHINHLAQSNIGLQNDRVEYIGGYTAGEIKDGILGTFGSIMAKAEAVVPNSVKGTLPDSVRLAGNAISRGANELANRNSGMNTNNSYTSNYPSSFICNNKSNTYVSPAELSSSNFPGADSIRGDIYGTRDLNGDHKSNIISNSKWVSGNVNSKNKNIASNDSQYNDDNAQSRGEYESQLVENLCASCGARVVPPPELLDDFVNKCGQLDTNVVAKFLVEKLLSGTWQQKTKVFHALELCVERNLDLLTGSVLEQGQDALILAASNVPQCKAKGAKVMGMLGLKNSFQELPVQSRNINTINAGGLIGDLLDLRMSSNSAETGSDLLDIGGGQAQTDTGISNVTNCDAPHLLDVIKGSSHSNINQKENVSGLHNSTTDFLDELMSVETKVVSQESDSSPILIPPVCGQDNQISTSVFGFMNRSDVNTNATVSSNVTVPFEKSAMSYNNIGLLGGMTMHSNTTTAVKIETANDIDKNNTSPVCGRTVLNNTDIVQKGAVISNDLQSAGVNGNASLMMMISNASDIGRAVSIPKASLPTQDSVRVKNLTYDTANGGESNTSEKGTTTQLSGIDAFENDLLLSLSGPQSQGGAVKKSNIKFLCC